MPPSHLCRRRSSPSRVVLLLERVDRVVSDGDPEAGRDRLEERLRQRVLTAGDLCQLRDRDRSAVEVRARCQDANVRVRRNVVGIGTRALVDHVVVVRNVTRARVLESRLARRLAREQPSWIEPHFEAAALALERLDVPVLDDLAWWTSAALRRAGDG